MLRVYFKDILDADKGWVPCHAQQWPTPHKYHISAIEPDIEILEPTDFSNSYFKTFIQPKLSLNFVVGAYIPLGHWNCGWSYLQTINNNFRLWWKLPIPIYCSQKSWSSWWSRPCNLNFFWVPNAIIDTILWTLTWIIQHTSWSTYDPFPTWPFFFFCSIW